MLSSSKKNQSILEIKVFESPSTLHSKILESHQNSIWACKHPIKQIDTKLFDKNLLLEKSIEQCVSILNLENRVAQMNLLEIEANESLSLQTIYELNFERNYLGHVEASHFIKGESALLYDLTIFLADQACHNDLTRLKRISHRIEPLFNTNHNSWNSVKFGAGPRQLVYSDSTQMISVDSRVANLTNKRHINLFSLPNKFLQETNELIYRTQTFDNHHFICGSKNIVIIDERCPNRPLLNWKNLHQFPILHLDVANLFDDGTRAIVTCDKKEVYTHLFSLKTEVPVAFNYPHLLSTSSNEEKESIDDDNEMIKNVQNISYSLISGLDYMGLFEVSLNWNIRLLGNEIFF